MQKPTLTIFANFRIDSEERLQRMKDSFLSFRAIDAEKWVVNIRGQYKVEARNFLEERLDSRLIMFQLESPEGWFHDSRIMSAEVNSEYVFFWVEDHICLRLDKINPTLDEMKNKGIDLLTYSFCHQGQARAYYGNNDIVDGEELDWFVHTPLNNLTIQMNMNGGVRLVSCVSIMTRALFNKVLFQNKKFIWPKETPFDFEVAPTELQFLPLKRGLPKYELFANIDDDNDVPNTCLISRGLYPDRIKGSRITATTSIRSGKANVVENKPSDNMIFLINGYRVGQPVLPTGIGYVAQALEDAGINYDVCDVNLLSNDQIVELISARKPDFVGLGTMTFDVEKNYQLLQTIKTVLPNTIIIMGGPHAIAAENEIFQECSAIDIVIQGEGEESLVKLMRGVQLQEIPGVLARDRINNGPPYEPLIIESIAFPKYRKFDLKKYGATMNIASSRGCVYKCTFCGAPKFLGEKWRAFAVSRMIEEFEYWYIRGYRSFYFSDSLFALDKRRVIEFCAYIINEDYKDVVFTADGARADHLTLEVLQHLKKANFRYLTLGVESVNNKTLEFFNKKETFEDIDNTISLADSLGFDITIYLIVGAPVEPYEDALKSIYYPLKYRNIANTIVSKLVPIKGTPYYEYALNHNLVADPDLCYPAHEAANFNKKNDSQTPVEKIWDELLPEIQIMNKFIRARNDLKNSYVSQGINQPDINTLNITALKHLVTIYGESSSLIGLTRSIYDNTTNITTDYSKSNGELSRVYNETFYNEQKDASYKSAEVIVPILLDVLQPKSVIDIGCGVGGWLHVFQKNGVANICGYDANDLAADKYFIDKKQFRSNADLSNNNFRIHERSDLLICLEVAEHLPAEAADQFILNLTNASPIVVFSAALPGQTGVNHINEQPPWYWREKFNKYGYTEIDFIRPNILRNEDICWWYRQNITCFVRPNILSENPKLSALAKLHGQRNGAHKLTIVNEWVLKHILNGELLSDTPAEPKFEVNTFLSVIIPTRNRAALLYNTLESLTSQTYPAIRFEVIVVDNGSTDSTAEVCKHFERRIPQFKRIYDPRPGLHNGRHTGLDAANGDILVYADDDIVAMPTWLEGIAESFVDPSVALVGGKILPKFESLPPEWVDTLSRRTDSGWTLGWYSILDFGDAAHEIPHEYVWGCNFSIRKDILKQVGGFHPDSVPQDLTKYRGDGETAVSFAVRDLGLKAMYNPKAAVQHLVSTNRLTVEYIYQRAFNQGVSNSYSSIRENRAVSPAMHYTPSTAAIHETVDRGMVDGFNYHQQLVQVDSNLQEWVLRDNYFGKKGVPK